MTWKIESAQTEEAWTHDYAEMHINLPTGFPKNERHIGNTLAVWEELDPKVAAIRSEGGTPEDRYLAEQIVLSDLRQHGYDRAEFTLDATLRKTAGNELGITMRRTR